MIGFVAELRDFLMGIFTFVGLITTAVMGLWFALHAVGWIVSKCHKEPIPHGYWNPFSYKD